MSAILITNIHIRNPKDYFTEDIQMCFDIEILQTLSREFEFRVVYIGSPDSSEKDQVLELIRIQPLPVGKFSIKIKQRCPQFQFEDQSPRSHQDSPGRLARTDSAYDFGSLQESGVLSMLVFCIQWVLWCREYKIRAVHFSESNSKDHVEKNSQGEAQVEEIMRSILIEKPRLRVKEIVWDSQLNLTANKSEKTVKKTKRISK